MIVQCNIILLIYYLMAYKIAIIFLLTFSLTLAAQLTTFDYSNHGDDWSQQSSSWSNCAIDNQNLNQQSPIQLIDNLASPNSSFLFMRSSSTTTNLQFLNTTIYAKGSNFGQIYTRTVGGDIVPMKGTEIRFRSHAQHKINGRFYDLEMQIFFVQIYTSNRNEKLALSVMFQVDGQSSNSVLKAIKDSYVKENDPVSVKLNLSPILNNEDTPSFWYYKGSSTIPPCKNGNLEWIISKKVLKMSQEQRDFFYNRYNTDTMKGNHRNIQPLRNNLINSNEFSSK